MFLWGAEYLGWNVRWILGYQGGGELRLAFERGETDLYATANLVNLARAHRRRIPPAHATGQTHLVRLVSKKTRV